MPLVMVLQTLLYVLVSSASVVVTPAQDLKDQLLDSSYDPDSRSTVGTDYVTIVTVIPNMFTLLSMDQQQETIMFVEEFLLTWNDPLLTWNPNDTAFNKEWLKLRENRVWTPDVIFASAISIDPLLADEERMIDLKYDGTLRQLNPSVVEYPCALSMSQFPFDEQTCDINIGSWMYRDTQILVKSKMREYKDFSDRFKGNSEWELESMEATEDKFYFPFSIGNFSEIKYRITLKRKPVYYVLVIQAPTFIVSSLTLLGLFTPISQTARRQEKVTLGLNMFVSISILLNLVSDMMPKAERLPLLGNYILAEIFVCGSGVIVSIIILSLHQKCYTRAVQPPRWVRRIILLERSSKVGQSSTDLPKKQPIEKEHEDSRNEAVEKLKREVLTVCTKFRDEIKMAKMVQEIQKTWNRVFDRIDIICLVIFQMLNIGASVMFMR